MRLESLRSVWRPKAAPYSSALFRYLHTQWRRYFARLAQSWFPVRCEHCHGFGELTEYDAHLAIHFKRDTCYFCAGTGRVPYERWAWYRISQESTLVHQQLSDAGANLENALQRYRRELRFPNCLHDTVLIQHNANLAHTNDELDLIDRRRKAYDQAIRLAKEAAYNLHALDLVREQRRRLWQRDTLGFDRIQNELRYLDEVKQYYRSEWLPQFHHFYVDRGALLSSDLRNDLRQAVRQLSLRP